MNSEIITRIREHLTALYGEEQGLTTWSLLESKLEDFRTQQPELRQQTARATLENLNGILITYADQIRSPNQPPLQVLSDFIENRLQGLISGVHLLPFFPYSSDDGFAVIDYKTVDSAVGKWSDLEHLRICCQLMFDLVINHASSQSEWFRGYLQDHPVYRDYFITVDPDQDLSLVVRPRAKPLLTAVETKSGKRFVWTTFSPDQIDLNFKNPAVLLEFIDFLLFYIQQGASLIRLDAIAYLWKEPGTSCIHLPQTHQIIKLLRAVLDLSAPGVILITETNVPHQENISYFGKQLTQSGEDFPLGDEAQMVYQFPMAPLVLHTFRTEDSRVLTEWAASLELPFSSAVFLNFIASHDGIGVRPAEGLLSSQEIQGLVNQALDHGGQVSYKTDQDGTDSVYELNITLYDALNHPRKTPQAEGIRRFLASQAIMLSLAGIPGIYFHSLFGSSNSLDSVKKTGRARSINREKFSLEEITGRLDDPQSTTSQVFQGYSHLLDIRNQHPAFGPLSPQQILRAGKENFALLRYTPDREEFILALINVTSESIQVGDLDLPEYGWTGGVDLLSKAHYKLKNIKLDPFQVVWLKLE